MADTKILTLGEITERTRLPLATLRYHRHLRTGVMAKSFKIGRRVVLREEDLEAWLEEQYRNDNPAA